MCERRGSGPRYRNATAEMRLQRLQIWAPEDAGRQGLREQGRAVASLLRTCYVPARRQALCKPFPAHSLGGNLRCDHALLEELRRQGAFNSWRRCLHQVPGRGRCCRQQHSSGGGKQEEGGRAVCHACLLVPGESGAMSCTRGGGAQQQCLLSFSQQQGGAHTFGPSERTCD